MITKKLIHAINSQYTLDWHGIHGIRHWARVYTNGLRLADETGANINIVKLFAIFHDSRRLNEGTDDAHGSRGAQLAEKYRGKYFDLPDEDFDLLLTACRLHTVAETHDDITVQTCFDADRLDLARVGKMPDPKYLCTDLAKTTDVIAWANNRSIHDFSPDIMAVWKQ